MPNPHKIPDKSNRLQLRPRLIGAIAATSAALLSIAPAIAEDVWNPFLKRDEPRRGAREARPEQPPPLAPMDGRPWWSPSGAPSATATPEPSGAPSGYSPPPWAGRRDGDVERSDANPRRGPETGPLPSSVERDNLPPVPGTIASTDPARRSAGDAAPFRPMPDGAYSSDRSGSLWGNLKVAEVEALLTTLPMPPRSPALAALWRRLWIEGSGPPAGPDEQARALAVRLEVLYRSGMLGELQEAMLAIPPDMKQQPLIGLLVARTQIGIGQHGDGCQTLKASAGREPPLPPRLKPEVTLLAGYCAAVSGNVPGIELAASLAREQGAEATSIALQVLDQMARGGKAHLPVPKQVSLTDFRFLDVSGAIDQRQAVERGEAAVLTLFALGSQDAELRIVAAEQAARLGVLPSASLAEAYRAASSARPGGDAGLRRAAAFKAISAGAGAREIGPLLEDARRAGVLHAVAQAVAGRLEALRPGTDTTISADTVIEALVIAGKLDAAAAWTGLAVDGRSGSPGAAHWAALIDIADVRRRAPRHDSLALIERMSLTGRVKPELLHRLVTVLNALEMQVPLPLWEAASAHPQPTGGYLPETGVLSELQAASKAREAARTILLTIKALGPGGADGANLLALDDAIRALKRSGFESEARMLATEALLGLWPRQSG